MSKSRSSIFSTWSSTAHKDVVPHSHSNSHHHQAQSPSSTFSPSSTTSSPLTSTGPNSPSLCLSLSDPFSCAINLPEPYRPSQAGHVSVVSPTLATDTPHTYTYHSPHAQAHGYAQTQIKSGHGQYGYGNPSTKSLVSGTEHTPKITVASPSTGTIHYLFPDLAPGSARSRVDTSTYSGSGVASEQGGEAASRLDPSAARSIARSIFKRQSRSVSDIKGLSKSIEAKSRPRVVESFYIPNSQLPAGSRPDPLKPSKGIVSGSSSTSVNTTTTSSTVRNANEKHPLSMRTLRRQPSMADLTAGRKRGEALKEAMRQREKENGATKDVASKRHSGAWKSLGSRRESDSWRDLVNSMNRDEPVPIVTDLISPLTTTFPPLSHRTREPIPEPAQYTTRTERRRSSSLTSPRPSGSFTDQSPSIPCPDFGDPIDFSVAMAESPSYSHFDYSTAGSSAMSRSTTMTRPKALPTSTEMARGDTRRGLGSYESAKVIARKDAAKRLAGEGPYAILRRSMSLKRERGRKSEISNSRESRPRSHSLSAKSVRDMAISPPVPLPTFDPKRQSLGPSRGIYLGDMSVDLGGRYTPPSPASVSNGSDGTSLYPASGGSAASYPNAQEVKRTNRKSGKPLHPALSGTVNASSSDVSILAPSSVGLGFSPVGTVVSLPESLEAEAIDLTGSYAVSLSNGDQGTRRLPKRSTSLHRIKLEQSPAKTVIASPKEIPTPKPVEGAEGSTQQEVKPRRSVLLAQNTFYIPPLTVPPSLRSSRSLSALKLMQDNTLPTPTELLPPAPVISRPGPPLAERRTRTTPGFGGLCSPSDAIDPLPHSEDQDQISPLSDTRPNMERKKSTPFLTASASIRGMFRHNSIARTLSHAFDKEKETSVPSSAPMSRSAAASARGRAPDGEREWREGLLREAVTSSFSLSPGGEVDTGPIVTTGRSSKRLPIPAQLLSAAPIMDEMTVEVEEEAIDSISVYSAGIQSGIMSPNQKTKKGKSKTRPSTPTTVKSETGYKRDISPPLPLMADLSHLGLSYAPTSPKPTSTEDNTRRPVGSIKTPPASHRTSVATTLGMSMSMGKSFRGLSLRPKKSRPRLNLPQPVSSATCPPPRPILDELTAMEVSTVEDKAKKVLEWRSEVEENGDLARLEEKMTKHVEREKEWIRSIPQRDA